ncbi:MAG: amidohydrolase [Candidatus Omnitrophica bacterium]|nr:amidohydrolase [Candidatus Omnitrophota bacterium]
MIVDAHMHIWNRVHGMIGNKTPVTPVEKGRIRIGDQEMLGMPAYLLDCGARAEFVVAEFDAAGVECGVVVQEYLDGEQNDYLLEAVDRFPGRFFVHGLPNFFDTDTAKNEAKVLFDHGFRGLKVPASHMLGQVRVDDRRLMPIWERMETSGFVLAVDLSEGEDQVQEMENILEAFPKLKVAIGHFGMSNRRGWPGQLHLTHHENVYIEGGGLVWLYRDEGYPFPGAIEAISKAIAEVGAEKIMWGSDWPRTMVDFTYRQSLEFVRTSTLLTEEEKRLFLGGNAARLYGIEEPAEERSPIPLITEG